MLSMPQFKNTITDSNLAVWPFKPEVESLWHFTLKSSPAEIWPYLADTSRLNREMGFGDREQKEFGGKLLVKTKMLGLEQRWTEEPWTWIENRVITCTRTYAKGLGRKMFSVFYVEEREGLTHVYVYFSWIARGFFWRQFLRATAGVLQNKFAEALAKIDQTLLESRGRALKALAKTPPPPTPEVAGRIEELRAELGKTNLDTNLTDRFLSYLVGGDSFDLEPLRVLPLARAWEVDGRRLLALCLQATRLSALKISWDVICPHCRGSRYSAENLGSIPATANCEICDIDFTTGDENSIEVLFHVHPSLRKIEAVQFCAAEPAKKAHIRVQQLVPAMANARLELALKPGLYRARAIGQTWDTQIEVDPNAERDEAPAVAYARVHSPFTFEFANKAQAPAHFVIEEMKWENESLRPGAVLALPEFRDVFAKEHLNSNVKLFLGAQAILFTDIVGSTNFYTRVGDAKAFAEVRAHFQELFKIVEGRHGVVVKTIGDAVMASFATTDAAIAAAVEIQDQFHDSRTDTSIRLRISVHSGPVIAVDLNTGLDYFGSTVNYAAKIQTCAGAGEVALSQIVYDEYLKLGGKYTVLKRQNSRDGAVKTDVFVLQISASETQTKAG